MEIGMLKIVFGLAALVGCFLQGTFIAVEHNKKYVPAVILKGAASFMFCLIGLLAFNFSDDNAAKASVGSLIVTGLIFGALGDILLNLRFVFEKHGQKIFLGGIAVFLTGHIYYLISLIKLSEAVLVCTICGVALAAILLTIIFKSFEIKVAFKIFGIVYIGAVSLMACFALGNGILLPSVYSVIYAVGGVLFLISDVVLIFNTFGPKQKFSLRITNLSLYYVGQLLIAASLFFLK